MKLLSSRTLTCLICLITASCVSHSPPPGNDFTGKWYINSTNIEDDVPMIDLLAINPDGSWETWFFYGGLPPTEWGNQESGEWQYKRGVLTVNHGEGISMRGNPIEISTVYSKVSVIGDKLILRQDNKSFTFERYHGHLDTYLDDLNTD